MVRRVSKSILGLRGTARRDRPHDAGNFHPLEGDPVKPKWLKADASKIWDELTKVYKARNQNVKGSEMALAHYCTLQADYIKSYERSGRVDTKLLSMLAKYQEMFFDTPASQIITPRKLAASNPFATNGTPPQGRHRNK